MEQSAAPWLSHRVPWPAGSCLALHTPAQPPALVAPPNLPAETLGTCPFPASSPRHALASAAGATAETASVTGSKAAATGTPLEQLLDVLSQVPPLVHRGHLTVQQYHLMLSCTKIKVSSSPKTCPRSLPRPGALVAAVSPRPASANEAAVAELLHSACPQGSRPGKNRPSSHFLRSAELKRLQKTTASPPLPNTLDKYRQRVRPPAVNTMSLTHRVPQSKRRCKIEEDNQSGDLWLQIL